MGHRLTSTITLALVLGTATLGHAQSAEQCFLGATDSRYGDGTRIQGNVGTNQGGGTLHLGRRTVVEAVASADAVRLGPGSQVDAVAANLLDASRASVGQAGAVTLPLVGNFCPVPALSCGDVDVLVRKNESHTLAPGAYGALVMQNGAELVLGPGTYEFCSVRGGRKVAIVTAGETVLNVPGTFEVGNGSRIGPDEGGVLAVMNAGDDVEVGAGSTVAAVLSAPMGALRIGRGVAWRGAFCADTVASGRRVDLVCDVTPPTTTTTSSTTTTSTTTSTTTTTVPTTTTTSTTTSSTTTTTPTTTTTVPTTTEPTTTSTSSTTTSSSTTTVPPTTTTTASTTSTVPTTTMTSTTTSSTTTSSTTTTVPPTTTTTSTTTLPPTTTTSSTTTTTLPGFCGDGNQGPGEECDDGNTVATDGCTATCTICGDRQVTDPDGPEGPLPGDTCDDGNLVDEDFCPSDCRVDDCTPSDTETVVTLNLNTPDVAALTLFLDYPEGSVSLPGVGGDIPTGTVTGPGTATTQGFDFDHAFRLVAFDVFNFGTTQVATIRFQGCTGVAPPASGDFTCRLEGDATDEAFLPVPGVTCSVSVQ